MSHSILVMGLILSATPIGEYDKRVVILTKEKGRISAFAKGARRPNSPLIGVINPFSFGTFTLYAGRSSYTLQHGSISNYFIEFRENMEAAYYGFYFMDIAGYYTREDNDEVEMLKLLYQTLRALVKKSIPYPLIRAIFELKSVCVNGEGPQVFQCVSCGAMEDIGIDSKPDQIIFSAQKGGIVCRHCKKNVTDGICLETSTLHALQFIVSASIEKLYTFTVKDEIEKQLIQVVTRYVNTYVDKRFKSLEILEMML